ncbi:MAG TPA: hypothetical protein VFA34_02190 [Actinomycetota bacterium]|jgi:hypothetical protein|nr:hypothetical protein [Actinomycetota bacterium]
MVEISTQVYVPSAAVDPPGWRRRTMSTTVSVTAVISRVYSTRRVSAYA